MGPFQRQGSSQHLEPLRRSNSNISNKSNKSNKSTSNKSNTNTNTNTNARRFISRRSWTPCSCFRLFFVSTIFLLVYLNVIHLNSRYLREIYTQGEQQVVAMMALAGSKSGMIDLTYEALMDQPTIIEKLPPIYWINLDSSVARRHAMRDMFASLGLGDIAHRVSAMDVNGTLDLWSRDQLIFHTNVTLDEQDGRPSNKKHVENIYEYQEAACLMSHLKAIRQAYLDGHSQVLILEDDALLSHNFLKQWKPYVDRAPLHWKILQFATNNPNVVKQGVNLVDYFITWQPYHWSTRAYVINRAGMQTLMDRVHSLSPDAGSDIWRIEEVPMVVADEVLYYMIGEAYTSTRLWVDSLSFGSTIQSKNAHSNLTSLIGDASRLNIMSYADEKRSESLLILMNVRARDLEELTKEIERIREDNHAISQIHDNCEWEIHLVVTDPVLMEVFQLATENFPKNIHFHTEVSSDPFNKFAYMRDFVDRMLEYDLVLFKDNDQRINGFPWRTFVKQKENAVVSGPLRQNTEEALLYRHSYPKRQWFQFHAAEAWTEDWNTKWSSQLFSDVVPTDVPLLEMYFVLFDAKFANYFFDMILTPEFVNQTSAWGPDLVWCSAAREWDPNRPSCYLVPVSSSHEDTRQIHKNTTTHKESGFEMVNKFKENPKFDAWMKVPEKWSIMIGGHLLWQVERRCRKVLKLRMVFPFDLKACPQKVYEMVANSALRGGEESHVMYQKMNLQAHERLAPWLSQLSQNSNRRNGIQNRTRVEELVQAVKNSRLSGTTNRNISLYADPDKQKKSLDAFQARLTELKKARAERLAPQTNMAQDEQDADTDADADADIMMTTEEDQARDDNQERDDHQADDDQQQQQQRNDEEERNDEEPPITDEVDINDDAEERITADEENPNEDVEEPIANDEDSSNADQQTEE